ncbi:neutrophil gelatinase-associated lipocalin-like isoform X2 [Heterocephalus glaber]|uniref:Neutrophil gelatinase-associated lipocalin-like isoform X2 n=1 Tax=Heterocephalus glaber TaxID=10181 RepID=A0AAX6TB58_HETGA|nr:neutrophil gelatinase-associated lipocalin-like isoform X2 [Heterocephalus glaber]
MRLPYSRQASRKTRISSFSQAMALGLLCLGLILLGGLQTKAFFPDMIKIPPLNKVPFQPDFQDDQFQGKWYSLGVADNTIQNGNGSQLTMYSVNYELQDDHSFNVNTSMLRDEVCEHSVETLFPGFQPGQFTLGNLTSYRGVMSYIVRVAATNYSHFAMVYVEKIVRFKWYYKMTLYGRTKKLRHKLKERFIKFTTSLDFTKDNIAFSVPIDMPKFGCHISNNAVERVRRCFLQCNAAHSSPQKPPP